jgi:hypothetical protein
MRRGKTIYIGGWTRNPDFPAPPKFVRLPIFPRLSDKKLSPRQAEALKDILVQPALAILKTAVRAENVIHNLEREFKGFSLLDLVIFGENNFTSLKNSGPVSDKNLRLDLRRQLGLDFLEHLPKRKRKIVKELRCLP